MFGLRGRYSPGGQRLLLTLTQEVGYDCSDDVAVGPKLSDFNLLTFTFSARVAWKFLPKTALFLELTQGAMHYLSEAARQQHRADSFPLRLRAKSLNALQRHPWHASGYVVMAQAMMNRGRRALVGGSYL